MKKDEFFARMRVALAGMDEETAGDILSEFETHFQEGLESGKTEEEICRELGGIEELEAAFRDENPAAVGRPVHTQVEAAASDDFDFDQKDIYNRRYPGIQRVQTQLIWADVTVTGSRDNCVALRVSGSLAEDPEKLKEQLTVTVSGGCLTIRQEKVKRSGGMSWRLFGSSFINSGEDLRIELELPESLKEFQGNAVSGDVEIRGIRCRRLLSETVSGDVCAEDCSADSCQLGSKSGDIRAERIRAEHADIHTVSGDIQVRNSSTSRIEVRSVSGDTRLVEKTAGEVGIQSTSGDISADILSSSSCCVRSISGDCRVRIGGKTNLEASGTSGDVNVYYTGGLGLEVKLSTTSGWLETDCGGLRQEGSKRIVSVYGEQDSRVKVSTVSGNITVKDYE